MSRSYKKAPVIKDHDSGRFGKRMANKKVRRSAISMPRKSMYYKRCYEQWDIHDYIYRWTKEQVLAEWAVPDSHVHEKFQTQEEYLNYWSKCAERK